MKNMTIGVDLAKNVIQVHGVNEHGKVTFRKQLRRSKVMEFFAQHTPCLVGMEACGSAHQWARQLMSMGYEVKLMAPQFVKPYVKSNKSDAADAEAICEAVGRPNMRFVAVKTEEQQAVLALHRARQGFVQQRTAQANQIRGLLAEYGVIIPQGIGHISKCVPDILENADNALPGIFRELLRKLHGHLSTLDKMVEEVEHQIRQWHQDNEASRRLAEMAGIGALTASALVASVGNAKQFKNGRQLAAWLGLVPQQHSTGGKQNLLGISKRGDRYLRTLLIHGARSFIQGIARRKESSTTRSRPRTSAFEAWLQTLVARRNRNIGAVALANKSARIVWALLAKDRVYDSSYSSAAPRLG